MSKYTTELRYICEHLAGKRESSGFNSIDETITIAAPKVFDFDYPKFAGSIDYSFEKQFLREYYTREICEETYGLWKLRLQSRLHQIIPYYNDILKSTLLDYNPLHNTDLTTTGNRELRGKVNDTEAIVRNILGVVERDENETANQEREISGSTNKTGRMTGAEETTNDLTDTTNDNTQTTNTTTNDLTDTFTGETRNTNTTTNDLTNTTTNSGTTSGTTTNNLTDKTDSTNTQTNTNTRNLKEATSGTDTTTGTQTNDTTDATTIGGSRDRWDLYSDTPQGGITGIERASAPASTTPSLSNNGYLTNARHIMESESGVATSLKKTGTIGNVEGVQYGKNVDNTGTMTDAGSGEQHDTTTRTGTVSESTTLNTTANETKTGTVSEQGNETANNTAKKTGTVQDSGQTTVTGTTTKTGTVKTDDTRETEETGTNTENLSGTNIVARTSTMNTQEDENVSKTGENLSEHNETNELRVTGKTGGDSYSKMVLEYRATIINITAMLIEEFADLFMLVW